MIEMFEQRADGGWPVATGQRSGEDAADGHVVGVQSQQGDIGWPGTYCECGHEGDAEPGGDAAEFAGPFGGDDVDAGLESDRQRGPQQGVLGDGRAGDERLVGQVGQADRAAAGEAMIDRHGDQELLVEQVFLISVPVTAAATGTMTLLVGGHETAVDRVGQVLAVLGTVRRCGAVGAGAALKLVLNTALVTSMAALADALAVADAVDVDRATAWDALRSSTLAAAVTRAEVRGASFPVALAGKDTDLALGEVGPAPTPVLRATARALRAASDQTADISTLIMENS
jgi:hypothetical protein